ncbi:MAG TPA: PAS domain S-box protein [Terriglobales bacterium]|nr:PAS domain S-box protein [Terriglobales bacterium]
MSTALSVYSPAATEADSDLLRAAFDSCPESVAVVYVGRILHANPAFANLFGYLSSKEIQGKPLANFLPENYRCAGSTEISGPAEPVGCGYPVCEYEGRRKDGTRCRMESSCAPFTCNGRNLLVVTARDISRRERRRIARDTEKRYRAIFDAAAIGIVQCTSEGRVVETNPAVERILGYTRQELRGMHFRDITHPDDFPKDLEMFEQMVAGKCDSYQMEVRYLRKDKMTGWCHLTVSLVRGPAGEPAFALCMIEDITEHKHAEEQLRESQKMEAVGRLVGGVAHDFNNLLTAVMLYSDLVSAGLESNSRLHRHVDEIRLASERGAALIQQLLAIARQQAVEPRVLSLNEIVCNMQNLLTRLIGENIELIIETTEDLANVKIDPAQLQQVILNLVLNARDAMPQGGRIHIRTQNCRNQCRFSRHGREMSLPACVELVVTDTGVGMDEETRSHLFQPFFTTKSPGQGNGLGLATAYGIIKEAGGSIEVDSEPGKGTRVTVVLPRVEEPTYKQEPTASHSAAKAGRETILLVEDDSSVRGSVLRVLTECGYKVIEAANSAEALRLSDEFRGNIDLLLTDLVMPGMGGREVAQQLRRHRTNLCVLFTSGYSQEQTRQIGNAQEEIVLFRKPFTGSALTRKVRELLDAHPARNTGKKKG